MKQKDLIVLVIIVFMSGVISLILSNFFITAPKNRKAEVEVVETITADFPRPAKDDKYFNSNSINLTQTIRIGDGNQDPFSD